MILAALLLATAQPAPAGSETRAMATAMRRARQMGKAGFSGIVLISRKGAGTVSTVLDEPAKLVPREARWRWASVTKQVAAVIAMQEVAAGRLALDAPVASHLPAAGTAPDVTIRRLMQHTSGLFDPEEGAKTEDGVPRVYAPGGDTLAIADCLRSVRPVGSFRYNNCDFVVLGAVLEAVTGEPFARLVETRIAAPLGLSSVRLLAPGEGDAIVADRASTDPGRYGAAAGLAGTAFDLVRFDRALLDGKLLPPATRAEMWTGDPALGFAALGQWSFEARVPGCRAPVRVVERRGAVGVVQVRNLLLPDSGTAIVAFTADPDFDFGEIWQGHGFAFDLVRNNACGKK
jgi:D-alanyl-D-alanine carboxypeptidase